MTPYLFERTYIYDLKTFLNLREFYDEFFFYDYKKWNLVLEF